MEAVARQTNRILEAIPAQPGLVEWYNSHYEGLFGIATSLGADLPDSFNRPIAEPSDLLLFVSVLFVLKNKIESPRLSALISDRAKENLEAVLNTCSDSMVG